MKRCNNCKKEYPVEMVKHGLCVYCRSEGLDEGEVGGAIPSDKIGQDELSLEPEGSEVMDMSYGYETL